MKLGFVSAIFPDLTLGEVFAFAREQGFACLELMSWPAGKAERNDSGVTHVDVTHLTSAHAEDILALAEEHGLTISALGYYPNLLDPDPEVAKAAMHHLKRVIKGAALLELNTVNTFVGGDSTKSVDENWPRFLKVWKPLIAYAEDLGVRIAIENCPMLYTADQWPGGKNLAMSPAIWRRMFNDIPSSHFGLNYDPSHFVLQQMDPIAPLPEFKEKLFHLHAKDAKICRDRLNDVGIFAHAAEWYQSRIPGYGEIDWARFIAAVTAIGYNGPVCIEIGDDTFGKTLEGRQKALKVARNILKPFFA